MLIILINSFCFFAIFLFQTLYIPPPPHTSYNERKHKEYHHLMDEIFREKLAHCFLRFVFFCHH